MPTLSSWCIRCSRRSGGLTAAGTARRCGALGHPILALQGLVAYKVRFLGLSRQSRAPQRPSLTYYANLCAFLCRLAAAWAGRLSTPAPSACRPVGPSVPCLSVGCPSVRRRISSSAPGRRCPARRNAAHQHRLSARWRASRRHPPMGALPAGTPTHGRTVHERTARYATGTSLMPPCGGMDRSLCPVQPALERSLP